MGTVGARAGPPMRAPAGVERGRRSIMHSRSCSVPCHGTGRGCWALRAGSAQLTGTKPLDHLFTDRYSDGIADHSWPFRKRLSEGAGIRAQTCREGCARPRRRAR